MLHKVLLVHIEDGDYLFLKQCLDTIPSVMMFVFYSLSLVSLTFALKKIDVSIAYAIWSGAGTALIAIIGILFLYEPVSAFKIFCLILIIAGVVGLNFARGGMI